MTCSLLMTALTQGIRGELQADTCTSIVLSVKVVRDTFHSSFFLVFFEIRTIKFLLTNWLPDKGYDVDQLWKKIEVIPFTMNKTPPVLYLSLYFFFL